LWWCVSLMTALQRMGSLSVCPWRLVLRKWGCTAPGARGGGG
jgi:hypothetical protein